MIAIKHILNETSNIELPVIYLFEIIRIDIIRIYGNLKKNTYYIYTQIRC